MRTFAKVFLIFLVCLVLPEQVFSQANTWPDFRGNMIGVPMSANGSMVNGIMYCEPPISDTLPMVCYFQGADAWEQATGGNRVGGNIAECPGIGTRQYVIDNFSLCAGDNVHIIVDGTDITLTEGAQWNRGASNNAACISLAAAVEASAVGTTVVANCPGGGAIVYIHPEIRTCWIDLTESDATCTTLVEGVNGQLLIAPQALTTDCGLAAVGMSTTGFAITGTSPATSAFRIIQNGATRMSISTETRMNAALNLYGNFLYSTTGPAQTGTLSVSGHALAAGDVIDGGKFECNGDAYFDASVIAATTIVGTSVTNIGWNVAAAADQACNTTCVNSACVFGQNTAALTYSIVDCADATADRCICAGAP